MKKEKVLIFRCADYDPDRIAEVIGKGMDELGIVPTGRVMVKPNVVIAHKRYMPNAFTRPEFVDGILSAVKARGRDVTELAVGEKCGITMPNRFCLSQAGYPKVIRKHGVRCYHFDECHQIERRLHHPDRLRDSIFVPQPIDECEFLISAPKLKSHPWTRITNALKNFIGIQDDSHRLIDHDYLLETKIADLQEVIQPKFIAVDAIWAGELKMLTPEPYYMGAVIMGTNQVAVDVAACHMIHFDPRRVPHIVECHRRGYGPIDMEGIEIGGDFPMDEVRKVAEKFRVPVETVDQVFNDRSNLKIHVGTPPDPDKVDYCWGGCPGSLIEAMEIIKTMQPEVYHEVRPTHFIFGRVKGEIDVKPGEWVVFCGDCAAYRGKLGGREVNIASVYETRDRKDVHRAKAKDLVARILRFVLTVFRSRKARVIRAPGCPVSVAENVLYLWKPGGTKNPYFDIRVVLPFARAYVASKIASLFRKLFKRKPRPKLLKG
jgi:uncharacterized protein (DUF362 family)